MSKRKCITFNNCNYYYNPDMGYWETKLKVNNKRTTYRLHQAVWEYYNGKIVGNMHIHHIDGNKSNNDISNLELLTPEEHLKKHSLQTAQLWQREDMKAASKLGRDKCKLWHASEEGKKWHSLHQRKVVEKNIITKICLDCGNEFRTWKDKREQTICRKCRDKYLKRELRRLKKLNLKGALK